MDSKKSVFSPAGVSRVDADANQGPVGPPSKGPEATGKLPNTENPFMHQHSNRAGADQNQGTGSMPSADRAALAKMKALRNPSQT